MSYRVLTISLNAVTPRTRLLAAGHWLQSVAVVASPAGPFQLAFGDEDLFTVDSPVAFTPTDAAEQGRGLYYAVPNATAGATVELVVATVPVPPGADGEGL